MPRIYRCMSLAEKFNRHIGPKPEIGCWLWVGAKLKKGYGHLNHEGKYLLAHRVAYVLENGSIPDGLLVLHTCDNPSCVRPSHLYAGTHADNTADMHSKGRGRKLETYQNRPRKTHCSKGHELTPDNVIWTDGGKSRRCLVCYRESSRARSLRYLAKNREKVNQKKRDQRSRQQK